MPNLIDDAGLAVIQETVDKVDQLAPFSGTQQLPKNPQHSRALIRGYLMQSVSQGQQALVALVSRQPQYMSFKIDLAGVIYLNHPDGDSRFKLRFRQGENVLFDVPNDGALSVEELTAGELIKAIHKAADPLTQQGDFIVVLPREEMLGALGHPTQHTLLILNDDIYPLPPDNYKYGDMIDSHIGSWIFCLPRHRLPQNGEGFNVQLLFSLDPDDPVQLNGPAVMTIHEIHDVPTGKVEIVTDVMELAQPSPLRGGTMVVLGYFEDCGYGIVAANPREYLFRLDFDPEAAPDPVA